MFGKPGFGLSAHELEKKGRFFAIDAEAKRGKDLVDNTHISAHRLAGLHGFQHPLKQEIVSKARGMSF